MNQSTTGKFISKKRKEKNLTQEQLAEKLGVSNKTVSKWETGKCMPDYSVVKDLCKELDISIAELMDGEESEEKSVRVYGTVGEDKKTGLTKRGKVFLALTIFVIMLLFAYFTGISIGKVLGEFIYNITH